MRSTDDDSESLSGLLHGLARNTVIVRCSHRGSMGGVCISGGDRWEPTGVHCDGVFHRLCHVRVSRSALQD